MTLTDFKCALKILGWKLIVAQRQSKWADKYGNSIVFKDDDFRLRLQTSSISTENSNYSYFQNLEPILERIIEHAETRERNSGDNKKPIPGHYSPNGLAPKNTE